MRLTVLGSAASYPGAGHACAGYLVSTENTNVLLDCGNGSLANLACVLDPTLLDAVFVTHPHVDHFADIYALQAALRYAPSGAMPPLPLYLPEGLFARMGAVLSTRGAAELASAFTPHDLAEAVPVRVGDLTVTPLPVEHVSPTYALRVEADGVRLAYTADCMPGEAAERAAEGASLLVADATLPPAYEGRAPHMTSSQAAGLAARAGARTLVLSHLWPSVDREAAAADARERFGGRVIVAEELTSIEID